MGSTKKVKKERELKIEEQIIDIKKNNEKKAIKKELAKTGKTKNKKVLTEEQLEEELQNISLADLLLFLKEYKDKKRTESNFEALMKCIKVRSYMPLLEKASLMLDICIDLRYSVDKAPELKTIELELKSLFIVLLAYTNIVCSKEELNVLMDFDSYDLLMETGVVDLIKKVCEKDYNKLMDLINQMFSFESISQIFSTLGNFDVNAMLEGIKEGSAFLKDFPEEKLKELSVIAGMEDPLVKQISEIVRQ